MTIQMRILGVGLLLLVGAYGCGDSKQAAPCDLDAAVGSSALGLVHGRVTDDQGRGVKDITVGTAETKVQTRSDGTFELAVPAGEDKIVSVADDKRSEAATLVRVAGSDVANVELKVSTLESIAIKDAKAGGRFEGKDGFAVELPKESLQTSDGKLAEGKAEVRYVTLKDPKEMAAAPGQMREVDGEGKEHSIAVVAIAEVRFYQGDKRLEFKGKGAQLELPVSPTRPLKEGEELERYSYDEKDGRWKREGTATTEKDRVVAKVDHFSWWAAGERVGETACVSATLLAPDQTPAAGTRVTAIAVDALLIVSADTNAAGEVCLPLPAEHEFELSAFFGAGEGSGQWQATATTSSTAAACGGSSCTELGEVRLDAIAGPAEPEPPTDGGVPDPIPEPDAGATPVFEEREEVLADTQGAGAASLMFEAVAGQRISFSVTRKTGVDGDIVLLAPSGEDVSPIYSTASGVQTTDAVTLEETGTYRLQVGGQGDGMGTYAVEIWGVPDDVTAPIEIDGPAVTVKTTVRNQNAVLMFDAKGGERLAYRVTSTVSTYSYFTVVTPVSGADVSRSASGVSTNAATVVDAFVLPEEAGRYRLEIDQSQLGIGGVTVELWSVPADATVPIMIDGPAVTLKTTVRSQNAVVTFNGAAGDRLAYSVSSKLATYTYFELVSPVSATDVSGASSGVSGNGTTFVDAFTLPDEAGTYRLELNPSELGVGSLTVKLWRVPADASAVATVGGAPVSINIGTPNQNGRFTFQGTQGSAVQYSITNNTNAYAYLELFAPSGLEETPALSGIASGATDASEAFTLAESGIYELRVNASEQAVGTFSFTISLAP